MDEIPGLYFLNTFALYKDAMCLVLFSATGERQPVSLCPNREISEDIIFIRVYRLSVNLYTQTLPRHLQNMDNACLLVDCKNCLVCWPLYCAHKYTRQIMLHNCIQALSQNCSNRLFASSHKSASLSVTLHETTRHPLDGFSSNLISGDFSKIFRQIRVSLNFDKNNGHFT